MFVVASPQNITVCEFNTRSKTYNIIVFGKKYIYARINMTIVRRSTVYIEFIIYTYV